MSQSSQRRGGDPSRQDKRPLREGSAASIDLPEPALKKVKPRGPSAAAKSGSTSSSKQGFEGRAGRPEVPYHSRILQGSAIADSPSPQSSSQSRSRSPASRHPRSHLRTISGNPPTLHPSQVDPKLHAHDQACIRSKNNVLWLKRWIDEEKDEGTAWEAEHFLDKQPFTPEELTMAMFYAHRQASNAVEQNMKLRRDAMAPFRPWMNLTSFTNDAEDDKDSRYVIPLETLSKRLEDPHLHEDPRFKRTLAVLASCYTNLLDENNELQQQADYLQRLRRWVDDPERAKYELGEEVPWLNDEDLHNRIRV